MRKNKGIVIVVTRKHNKKYKYNIPFATNKTPKLCKSNIAKQAVNILQSA